MESLATVGSGPLYWTQPKTFGRNYELRTADGALVASLGFASTLGSLATATSGDGTWTFKRVGFFNPRVTARVQGEEADIAAFHPRMLGGGTLDVADQGLFKWESMSFWGTKWSLFDDAGVEVVSFSPGVEKSRFSDAFKTQARVEFDYAGRSPESLALLITLGWYLMILQHEDTAAVAAATSAAVTT